MTAIKQVAVTRVAHLKSMAHYLNDDRALARDSQNLTDEKSWAAEFDRTREAYGHNAPSRVGSTNTFMYHQVLGFNPDECAINGGKMTPDACMSYARDYVQERYPNQEAVWVLHKEHSAADGSDRYAVYIAINRTDLETGRRLNEGRSKQAKVSRANTIKDMDRKWGLAQLKANERNSRVHARQPTRAEKEMARRGAKSEKEFVRAKVREAVKDIQQYPQTNPAKALSGRLEADGIKMRFSKNGNDLQFQHGTFKVNGAKLGRGFSRRGIGTAIGIGRVAVHMIEREMDDGTR